MCVLRAAGQVVIDTRHACFVPRSAEISAAPAMPVWRIAGLRHDGESLLDASLSLPRRVGAFVAFPVFNTASTGQKTASAGPDCGGILTQTATRTQSPVACRLHWSLGTVMT